MDNTTASALLKVFNAVQAGQIPQRELNALRSVLGVQQQGLSANQVRTTTGKDPFGNVTNAGMAQMNREGYKEIESKLIKFVQGFVNDVVKQCVSLADDRKLGYGNAAYILSEILDSVTFTDIDQILNDYNIKSNNFIQIKRQGSTSGWLGRMTNRNPFVNRDGSRYKMESRFGALLRKNSINELWHWGTEGDGQRAVGGLPAFNALFKKMIYEVIRSFYSPLLRITPTKPEWGNSNDSKPEQKGTIDKQAQAAQNTTGQGTPTHTPTPAAPQTPYTKDLSVDNSKPAIAKTAAASVLDDYENAVNGEGSNLDNAKKNLSGASGANPLSNLKKNLEDTAEQWPNQKGPPPGGLPTNKPYDEKTNPVGKPETEAEKVLKAQADANGEGTDNQDPQKNSSEQQSSSQGQKEEPTTNADPEEAKETQDGSKKNSTEEKPAEENREEEQQKNKEELRKKLDQSGSEVFKKLIKPLGEHGFGDDNPVARPYFMWMVRVMNRPVDKEIDKHAETLYELGRAVCSFSDIPAIGAKEKNQKKKEACNVINDFIKELGLPYKTFVPNIGDLYDENKMTDDDSFNKDAVPSNVEYGPKDNTQKNSSIFGKVLDKIRRRPKSEEFGHTASADSLVERVAAWGVISNEGAVLRKAFVSLTSKIPESNNNTKKK